MTLGSHLDGSANDGLWDISAISGGFAERRLSPEADIWASERVAPRTTRLGPVAEWQLAKILRGKAAKGADPYGDQPTDIPREMPQNRIWMPNASWMIPNTAPSRRNGVTPARLSI